jgi:benzoyl-CoA reductase/2-hydroxyglutaryl-CoA dehydratase subunit BcrC/BadD/HgdB
MIKPSAYFTTSVPIEILLSAGYIPIDINNTFVSSQNPLSLIDDAESFGFPGSCCAWIKGLYSVMANMKTHNNKDLFIAVTEGDCSNAKVLEEVISSRVGINSYIFAYPVSREKREMKKAMEQLAQFLGTDLKTAEKTRKELLPLRKKLNELDRLSYLHPGLISGFENHYWLVSSSDMNGDVGVFEKELNDFIDEISRRKEAWQPSEIKKIAFLGVPPIIPVHQFIEDKKGIVVYNEIQREFAMIGEYNSLEEQYTQYTYPYSARHRFDKALKEIIKRNVNGIIHYVQSFCHRQIEDIILREMMSEKNIDIPLLTIEGDKPSDHIDGRLSTRIEAFLETI